VVGDPEPTRSLPPNESFRIFGQASCGQSVERHAINVDNDLSCC
jgi:hypothetical protein